MGEVIPLGWCAGRADCVSCHHTWTAVFPVGSDLGLECPNCGQMYGWAQTAASGTLEGAQRVLAWCMKNRIGPYRALAGEEKA